MSGQDEQRRIRIGPLLAHTLIADGDGQRFVEVLDLLEPIASFFQ
jgi:hypothetical protein